MVQLMEQEIPQGESHRTVSLLLKSRLHPQNYVSEYFLL